MSSANSNSNPISEAQLAANRANAQNSTGPRSQTAKQRTRLNGLRHGLTGQTVVMPDEDQHAYELACASILASLQPENDAERALAQSIANDSWRLSRARAIEENIFALGAATGPVAGPGEQSDPLVEAALNQAVTFLDHARELQLLTLYANRIARSIDKARAELNALQQARRQARENALAEALLLAELAQSKGETYDPAREPLPNGFGFSAAEIARLLDRKQRLQAARALFSTPQKSKMPARPASNRPGKAA